MSIDNICLVGVGLIGGSFAKALKQTGFAGKITGVVRSEAKAAQAIALGIIDEGSLDLAKTAAQSDLIMLAVPMLSMREQLEKIAPVVSEHTIITDAGSVKQPFIDDARATLPYLNRVVPGHPIAGKEKSGMDAVDASLYKDHRVLLTPLPETDESAVNMVRSLWEQTGAIVENLSPDYHDNVLAATSHLPHVLAFAMVDMLASRQETAEIFRYAAGGFRDFSRIASGEAVMWRDICLTNKEPVYRAIEELEAHLGVVKKAIAEGDSDTIEAVFRRAREAREEHIVIK